MVVKLLFILYLITKLTSGSIESNQMRSSDPFSFGKESVSPVPIGFVHDVANDVVGAPLTEEEFLYPPLVVDPPMMDAPPQKDPIERAGLFEGDIIVNSVKQFLDLTDSGSSAKVLRNAVKDKNELWYYGIVPYKISSSFDPYERGSIAFAMKEFHDNSCIRFKPKKSEKDYIHLIKADGCASSVGKVGGAQVVSLGKGCLTKGVVLHELMHSLGFWHEQARGDRDEHITIIWPNIEVGLEYNFGKYDWFKMQNLSVGYDVGSIMHYGAYAFAKDRSRPTIVANKGEEIGQRYGLSERDIIKINILYGCSTRNNSTEMPSEPSLLSSDVAPPSLKENTECVFWARQGECKKNKSYMNKYCKEACLKYGSAFKEVDGCVDKHPSCLNWTKKDQCRINPNYMLLYCKKSCKVCKMRQQRTPFNLRDVDSIINQLQDPIQFTKEIIKDKEILKNLI